MTTNTVRVVDFAPFRDGTDKTKVAAELLDSFKTVGFVYLTNHGVPDSKLEEMFDWTKKFFSLPLEKKLLAPHPPSGTHHRGYSAPGQEKVSQHLYDESELAAHRAKAPDVKESFESGREDDLVMPNIWLPEGVLPGYREACLDFYWICYELEIEVLKALSLAFDLGEEYFVRVHTQADNQLRLLHYPSVSADAIKNNKVIRIDEHSDFGSITLLFQDDIGGLEVEDPKNPGTFKAGHLFRTVSSCLVLTTSLFQPVPPVPGTVLINAGDFLMRWSNDTIKSAVHRVRAPPALANSEGMIPDRYSIPYFCGADMDIVVDCVPGTWSESNPKKYEPISAKEYVLKRLAASY
ncbi:thymine dioxygenase [Cyathus striatus]|nr:thymine dioxygenase [Cyathus striatus]